MIWLLFIPSVRRLAVNRILKSLSSESGLSIRVGDVQLSYPLKLEIREMTVTDPEQDTLFRMSRAILDVRPLSLLHGEIAVNTLQLAHIRLNTKTWINGLAIAGNVDTLTTTGGKFRPAGEELHVSQFLLSDATLHIRADALASSDTTSAATRWKIGAEDIRLQRVDVRVTIDSVQLTAGFDSLYLVDGFVDLGDARYSATAFGLSDACVAYHVGSPPVIPEGLDPLHLALSNIRVRLDSLFYQHREIRAQLHSLDATEQSGLAVHAEGIIRSDTTLLSIPYCLLRTPYSRLKAQVELPWQAAMSGVFRSQVDATLSRRDVLTALGRYAREVEPFYPDTLLLFSALLEGAPERMYLRRLRSELPDVFRIEADGIVGNIADNALRSGELRLSLSTGTSPAVQRLLPSSFSDRFRIPEALQVHLEGTLEKGDYRLALLLAGQQQGRARLSGHYDTFRKEYAAKLEVDSLIPTHFLPQSPVLRLKASCDLQGKGTDIYHPSTWIQFGGALEELQTGRTFVSGITAEGFLQEHRVRATVVSACPYAEGKAILEGELQPEKMTGTLVMDVDSLDLYGLRVMDTPFGHSFQLFSEIETDGRKRHRLDVTVGNWEMRTGTQKIIPDMATLHAAGDEDSARLSFHAGDLGIVLTGRTDMESTLRKLTGAVAQFTDCLRHDTLLHLQELRTLLPDVSLHIAAGHDNPVYRFLQERNIYFDRFTLDAAASPVDGVQMNALLLSLIRDTTRIDTLRMEIWQDETGIRHAGEVVKNRFRRQEPFRAGWRGSIENDKALLEAYYRNGRGETGLQAGLEAVRRSEGICFRLAPNAVIAFLPFSVNADNYVLIKNARNISAKLRLKGDRDASLWLHSLEEDSIMKELYVDVGGISLETISSGFGLSTPLRGVAGASLRYVPEENTFMIAADANVDGLTYRNSRIGDALLSGVYLPVGDSVHQIDLHLFHDSREIAALSATYQPAQEGRTDGELEVNRLPLRLFNPFLDGATLLGGALQGRIRMAGALKEPLLNGVLQADTATACIVAAGTQLRFDPLPIEIRDSRMQFNKYGIHAAGNTPFVLNGLIDLRRPAKVEADLKLTARQVQLMNAVKTDESVIYGKLFVDLNATLKGPLDAMELRGSVHLLGNTNLAYVLKESPLTVRDRMAGLVTFTHFRDTVPRRPRRAYTPADVREQLAAVGGLDMLLAIRVDPAVRLRVDLDNEASDRVELEGGGDLSFHYTRQQDMLLTGRYTLSDGLVKYNMPVIANKTLKIKENSYIEWTGDPFDPYLSLKATERIRSTVATDGQTPHPVNFEAGMEVKQRMANLSLQFTLDALDDATLQNRLIAMGPEERSKQAVGLLLAGVYLAGDEFGKKKLDTGVALNSFLQSEINHITGSLLKGVDLNFSMDTYDSDGLESRRRTDYAFRFAKRFYGERLNAVFGGRFSTDDLSGQNNLFINDAALEYRLDAAGSRYARLFYNRRYESLLEGEIAKYGVGVVFRRKMRYLYELFLFRKQIYNNTLRIKEAD
jgi:hypothetical protein